MWGNKKGKTLITPTYLLICEPDQSKQRLKSENNKYNKLVINKLNMKYICDRLNEFRFSRDLSAAFLVVYIQNETQMLDN